MERLHQVLDGKPSGQQAAVDYNGTPYTFGELDLESRAFAEILKFHGVRGGDRVVLVAENCVFYAAVVFAASRLNVWLTLVNARQSEQEIAAIQAHSQPRCILFTYDVSKAARDHAQRLSAKKTGSLKCGEVWVTECQHTDPEPIVADAEQVAVLLYTTGTTSAPKGVMLTHANLLFNAQNSARFNRLSSKDKCLVVLPGTHIFSLASVFLPAMVAGASVEFMARFDPEKVTNKLRQGVTRFPAVPQMFAGIMQYLDENNEELGAKSLVNILTGGAPLDPGLKARVEKVFGLPLNNGYGLTETSPSVSGTHNDFPRDDVGLGIPYSWIDVRIWEPNTDGIGEIQVRGKNIMKGYYKDPERTAEAMTQDNFFRTGDLGRFDDGGGLHVVGRLKELIIRSGFNVHPPEVEAMLSKHPNIYQAAVVGRMIPGNEEILAFVKSTGDVSEQEIKDWLRERLVAYKIPSHVFLIKDFPAAATGKILKHKLLDYFADIVAASDQAVSQNS